MLQSKDIREEVEEVCVDMWGGFEKVISDKGSIPECNYRV